MLSTEPIILHILNKFSKELVSEELLLSLFFLRENQYIKLSNMFQWHVPMAYAQVEINEGRIYTQII